MSLREELHIEIDGAPIEELERLREFIAGLRKDVVSPIRETRSLDERRAAIQRITIPGLPVIPGESLRREELYREACIGSCRSRPSDTSLCAKGA